MNIKNDILLDVAVANSRKTKKWKNREILWSEILQRMSSTVRTPETIAEYRAMSKDRQSEIKDVGGFVGGYCNNGSRSDIRHRSIIALDADFAEPTLWDDWLTIYGFAAAIYSTHKHTPEKPRVRLVIPLSRNVSPDEYQAIGRLIAQDLGIDQFDDSTYQPQRVMYWPSTSQDGEFIFQYCDSEILDPDKVVLNRYIDWRDVSSWPMSSRVSEVIKKEAKRQADPTEKDGLIGAFCRAYTIEEAIETFVPGYVPCDEPNRYTYAQGSTAGGVTIYDHKFSYSFHATDPASGLLCNSWDLVRLHRFGDLDDDPTIPVSKRESYKRMTELASADPQVKAQIVSDHAGDFSDELPAEAPAEDPLSWTARLKVTKDGSVASTIENIVIILRNDPQLKGRIHYDEMSHAIIGSGLPWRESSGAWTDSDDSALRFYLERIYSLSGKDKIFDGVNIIAMENKRHPVREYLDGCQWDGIPRVERLLVDYLGARDTAYTRAVTRKALVAAVARIYRPGCKFDYMLTFRGRQGIGKSTLIKKLGGEWYSDSFSTVQGKDSYEQILGVWLMEVGELAGMRKAEAEAIKLYLSKQADRFRPAYGRRTQEFPRQCIFFGTTNETTGILRDTTGNRRHWIVDTPNKAALSVWDDLNEEEVRQIWGEAVEMFKAGEELFLDAETEAEARQIQAAYEEENPKAGLISAYLERLLPDNWDDMDLYARRLWLDGPNVGTVRRDTVSAIEVLVEALGGDPLRYDRVSIKEVNDLICQLGGWIRQGSDKISTKYGRQRFYKREVTA